MHHYVRTKVDADVAEDLVHDILIRIFKNENTLPNLENPLAWVYAIARNVITDYYRKQSTIKKAQAEGIGFVELPDRLDHDFTKCLRPLMKRLNHKYKEALLITGLDEVKQADAAKQIGISISGMKSRVQRARSQLKEELLACCAIEVDRFGKITDYEEKDSCNKDSC